MDSPLLPIQDNQVPLPVDLAVLDGVAYSTGANGPWVPVKKATGIFKEPKRHHNPCPEEDHFMHENQPRF